MAGRARAAEAWSALAWAVPLALAVWIVAFAWRPANFWLIMTAGVGGLASCALWVRGPFPREEGARWIDILTGAAAAAALYTAFALGRAIIGPLIPAAPSQIGKVYALGAQAPAWAVAFLLVAVIAPGEELFWRGLVEWGFAQRWGPGPGWAAATALYGAAHVAAANVLLVVAALVAGGFWGLLYLRIGRITPIVICHVLWDLAVFVFAPLH
jgi:uncharacterized protein